MKGEKTMKRRAVVAIGAVGISLIPVSVFASSTGTANADVTTAMTTIANDMLATGGAVIPVALSVIGLSMTVVFGIRIFKKVIGK